MSAKYVVLPVAGSALVRALASLLALVSYWLKALARARRHRREASVLTGLDRRMRERALERRLDHSIRRAEFDLAARRPVSGRP